MKKLLTFLMLIVAISVFNTQSVTAQTKEEKEAAKKAEKERKKREKEEAKAAKAKAEFESKNPIKVVYAYDKFEDLSKVVLSPLEIPPKPEMDTLQFSAGYTYSGNTPKEPEQIRLVFTSRPIFRSDDELILIVDGERLNLGTGVVQDNMRWIIAFDITMDTLQKISNATSIEGRIGGSFATEFVLTNIHLNALKELLKYQQNSIQ